VSKAASGETALFHCKIALSHVDLTSLKVMPLLIKKSVVYRDHAKECDVEGHEGMWWSERCSMGRGNQGSRTGRKAAWMGACAQRDIKELVSIEQVHLEHRWPSACTCGLGSCLVSVSNGITIP